MESAQMQTGTTCLDIAILEQNPLLANGMAALLERQPGTRAVALRALREAGPGNGDLADDVGFVLVTLLAPPLATLHREHVEAGEQMAAAAK